MASDRRRRDLRLRPDGVRRTGRAPTVPGLLRERSGMGGLLRADVPPRSTGSPRLPRRGAGHGLHLWIQPRPRWTTIDRGTTAVPISRARPRSNQTPGFVAFAGLGLLNALCLAAGLIGGVFIDRALGTRPLFIFLGMFAGIAMGVLVTRAAVEAILLKSDKSDVRCPRPGPGCRRGGGECRFFTGGGCLGGRSPRRAPRAWCGGVAQSGRGPGFDRDGPRHCARARRCSVTSSVPAAGSFSASSPPPTSAGCAG